MLPSVVEASSQSHAFPDADLVLSFFTLCGRAGLLSPVHSVVFLLYRPHRHRVSVALLRTHAPRSLPLLLSLVPVPLPAFQAVHQLRHPFPLATALAPPPSGI